MNPARTIVFGSGAFAVPILDRLAEHPGVRIVGVVTRPPRPAGRHGSLAPGPVAAAAARRAMPILAPDRLDAAATAALAALEPELGVLADYGRIVPPAVIAVPRRGILNVHPSLLPRHRGASPIPAAILAGDTETGVTVIAMDAGVDSGPIVARAAWPLPPDARAPAVEAAAAAAGAELLVAVLAGWLTGSIPALPQDGAAATTTRPLRREDGRLDPARPAAELERAVRAFDPWPGTFLETALGRLAILAAAIGPSQPGDAPGLVVADGDGLAVTTSAGRLRLLDVRPAGGRPMSASGYRRGHPGVVGATVRP